ncbi:MAG TPA: RiPP maturation radical SAM C-methyltransferase [Allosphingosinicella sp.]|jgi:ribosomal peptide maturation radical SAM protein 1|nr:RiPP maturation radical SAM C-methyltransferase [Allosphingosinicella sp.]
MPDADVLLISPPWRPSLWPSLALGTLKSRLAACGIPIECSHLHLDVAMRLGLDRYDRIAGGWEVGEALYFALYRPSEAHQILARTADCLSASGQAGAARDCTIDTMAELEAATSEAIACLDLEAYRLIGLSVGALQLGAAVYLADRLRSLAPQAKIVMGGSSLVGTVGARLLESLSAVDAVVDGEGEAALALLARESEWTPRSLAAIPNLRYRDAAGAATGREKGSLADLATAGPPDLDEYFISAAAHGLDPSMLVLPIEASRGCAWEHRRGDGRLRGCTFCGIYRTSPNFREKPLPSVLNEIAHGVERHGALELSFIDAYLPPGYAKGLLRALAAQPSDTTIFCEMRCDFDPETAMLLAAAGARKVQLGVEAFNTAILRKMAKGVRMIDNVRAVKLCEEHGVPLQYNLIIRFPGIEKEALDETLALLPALFGYAAPLLADFYLDRSSRIFAEPEKFGIDAATMDRDPLPFLPDSLAAKGISLVVPVVLPEDPALRSGWEAIETAVALWSARHEAAARLGIRHLLSFRDTGRKLVIEDHRGDEPLVIKIGDLLREILLAAADVTDRETLRDLIPGRDEARLEEALALLRKHRLVVEEGRSVLALPVRAWLPSGAPRALAEPAMAAQ